MGDLTRKVDDLIGTVSGARAMPLSASCVLNRVEMLAALEELRGLLSAEFAAADEVIARRDEILTEARVQAEQILVTTGRERERVLSDTELVREARDEADRLLASARESSRAMRREIDEYVDGKLATFEVVLQRTTASVARGRSRLAGNTGYGHLAATSGAQPEPPTTGGAVGDRRAGAGHVLVDPPSAGAGRAVPLNHAGTGNHAEIGDHAGIGDAPDRGVVHDGGEDRPDVRMIPAAPPGSVAHPPRLQTGTPAPALAPPTLAPPTLAPPTLAPPTLAPPTLAPPAPVGPETRPVPQPVVSSPDQVDPTPPVTDQPGSPRPPVSRPSPRRLPGPRPPAPRLPAPPRAGSQPAESSTPEQSAPERQRVAPSAPEPPTPEPSTTDSQRAEPSAPERQRPPPEEAALFPEPRPPDGAAPPKKVRTGARHRASGAAPSTPTGKARGAGPSTRAPRPTPATGRAPKNERSGGSGPPAGSGGTAPPGGPEAGKPG